MTRLPDHKKSGVGNDIFGDARLALARHVKTALHQVGAMWFLDGGTLLGAYRTGKFIPHDDDFDTAVYLPAYRGEADLDALKREMKRSLPPRYAIRVVTSYADKLEVYDPTSRCYVLPEAYKGADYHTVTVDVQVMTDADDGSIIYIHDLLRSVRVPRDTIEPLGEIVCEGERFNSPHDVVRFLEAQYGYLGADAEFDPATKKYVKLPS